MGLVNTGGTRSRFCSRDRLVRVRFYSRPVLRHRNKPPLPCGGPSIFSRFVRPLCGAIRPTGKARASSRRAIRPRSAGHPLPLAKPAPLHGGSSAPSTSAREKKSRISGNHARTYAP